MTLNSQPPPLGCGLQIMSSPMPVCGSRTATGSWSSTRQLEWGEALVGARAVLITHEDADHLDVACLAGWEVPVFAPADAAIDFAKDVEPEWLFAIHDGQLNGRGRSSLNNWCLRGASGDRYLAAGDTAW
jgi:hypothetical protein